MSIETSILIVALCVGIGMIFYTFVDDKEFF